MGARGSIPVQMLDGFSESTLFATGGMRLDGTEGAVQSSPAARFAPFTGDGESASAESESASERDQLLMEHLPTVRYLARRIHERLPQHVDLDDLISAGVVGLIDAFSKFDYGKKVQFKKIGRAHV